VQENTDKQTQYKKEKVNDLKYSKPKLPWFSCLLQHSTSKRGQRGGLILQRPRAHTGQDGPGKPHKVQYTLSMQMFKISKTDFIHIFVELLRGNKN